MVLSQHTWTPQAKTWKPLYRFCAVWTQKQERKNRAFVGFTFSCLMWSTHLSLESKIKSKYFSSWTNQNGIVPKYMDKLNFPILWKCIVVVFLGEFLNPRYAPHCTTWFISFWMCPYTSHKLPTVWSHPHTYYTR